MGSKAALTQQRKKLKRKLLREREIEVFIWPVCDYCGEPITHPDHCVMHEWLVRRTCLPVNQQYKIMMPENCILTHFQCHEDHETTREFKMRCAKAQYARYSRDKIVAWVESLGLRQHVEIPSEEEADAYSKM